MKEEDSFQETSNTSKRESSGNGNGKISSQKRPSDLKKSKFQPRNPSTFHQITSGNNGLLAGKKLMIPRRKIESVN
jgi:hypothetical protein